MTDYEKCFLHSIEYRNHSLYGNPSYYITFTDSEGNYHRGYTGSNSSAGYTIKNYRNAMNLSPIYLRYHYTRTKGTLIIDGIKHNTPTEASKEAEKCVK